jgi:ketosteroid isomerase-like protein
MLRRPVGIFLRAATAVTAMTSGLASCAARETPPRDTSADRAAIEALHQRDEAAVLAAQADSLIALWTDDIVAMPPGGPIIRGKANNAELLRAALAQQGEHRPLSYELRFEEVQIFDDHAFEWGTYRGTARVGADTLVGTGKLMRLLARDSTGTWRVARTLFTADPVTTR